MPRTDHIEIEGTITAFLGGGQYEIKPDNPPSDEIEVIRAQLCGKMRKNKIRLVLGDRVKVEVAPSDKSHGLVTWRVRQ
jgi:translation initiation factor IF-1